MEVDFPATMDAVGFEIFRDGFGGDVGDADFFAVEGLWEFVFCEGQAFGVCREIERSVGF